MKSEIELLAPGGDIHSIKAALLAGANAIYCGLDKFNARNRAENITFDDLSGIIRLAHEQDCSIFLTLNIVIVESELPAFFTLLNKCVNTDLDGIIIQDLGMLYVIQKQFPNLKVHASTQLTTHNAGQIEFLHRLGAKRVNLCRELNLDEIRELTRCAHTMNMQTEVFVHGSNCVSFSGLCTASSVHNGNSGNRGRCSQPCRAPFEPTAAGKNYPLNMKDTAVYADLDSLCNAGVDSLKIEGRIKNFDYVYSVTNSYRQKLDNRCQDGSMLRTVFNRDLTAGYIEGRVGAEMFTDNPRDQAAAYLAAQSGSTTPESIDAARAVINKERKAVQESVQSQIDALRESSISSRTGNRERIPPVDIPKLKHSSHSGVFPKLSVLINKPEDLKHIDPTTADLYFQLPSSLGKNKAAILQFLTENPTVTPWFPALLIGDEFSDAIRFLTELNPTQIVTNNSGMGLEATRRAIPWIAGPQLNCTNSYSLLCLKEKFHCAGAYLSNELNRYQIGAIKKPDDFKLFYSIYHPLNLMTSRQCLTQQVAGCEKETIDPTCQTDCARTSTLTNDRTGTLFVEKSKGNYHRVYHGENFLNTDILFDIPGRFDSFLIDLSDIKTATTTALSKAKMIEYFNNLLAEEPHADEKLTQAILRTTLCSYEKGI